MRALQSTATLAIDYSMSAEHMLHAAWRICVTATRGSTTCGLLSNSKNCNQAHHELGVNDLKAATKYVCSTHPSTMSTRYREAGYQLL
jgi:hypothetical protein